MKKTLYLFLLGCLCYIGFAQADLLSLTPTPASQPALSGSLVVLTLTGNNGSGDAYIKYLLPSSAGYSLIYQNASSTPINQSLLMLGAQDDPIFFVPAHSVFTITVTAKVETSDWSLPALDPVCSNDAVLLACTQGLSTCPESCMYTTIYTYVSPDSSFATVATTASFEIHPIADLMITNVRDGENPSLSGDGVSYTIQIKNIGSTLATGLTFVSRFPIPLFTVPIATFDNVTYPHTTIHYPQDFVWNGTYLDTLQPGQYTTIVLHATMAQQASLGTMFDQTASVTTLNPEYTAGNNSALATGAVESLADVWVHKTLHALSGVALGDIVTYTITYGNSGGQIAHDVVLTDIIPAELNIPTSTFTLGTLAPQSGGTIILTGTLQALYSSGHIFSNTATIQTSSRDSDMTNNSSTATGRIPGMSMLSVDLLANNLSRPQLDSSPYGSGSTILIQAVSGDTVRLTINYTQQGNTTGYNALLSLSDIQGFVSLAPYTTQLGDLAANGHGQVIVTGVVGPRNYISFAPKATISFGTTQTASDNITIQEPFVCGDGLLTRNEPCDTQGNLGVVYSGQVCENQQGICVLSTKSIINTACINYQYTNTLGVTSSGHACDDVNLTLTDPSCTTLTASDPITTHDGYRINYQCEGRDALATTPITIDCGNGTSIEGFGATLQGNCSYDASFAGHAQCKVGNDTANPACKVPVGLNQGKCEDLEALDGSVLLVNDDDEAEGNFRCETVNNVDAHIVLDCGNGDKYSSFGSVFEHSCTYEYDGDDHDQHDYTVKCYVDEVTNPACTEEVIIDDGGLSYCGNGIREGYEDCDDGDDNGTSASNCSEGCDLEGSAMVGCFNVGNTNISIQKGEILPFRWTLENTENIVKGSSCTDEDDGSIPEDSIMCTFNIYNGEDTEIDNDGDQQPIYTIKKKCNEDTRGSYSTFDYFLDKQDEWRSLKHAFGKYYVDSDEFVDDIFGEYKVSLDKVEYKYCLGEDKEVGTVLDRVCNTDFAVTQPYLAQKSSFGVTPKATSIKLDNYLSLLGEELISTTDLKDIMVLDERDYAGGNKVQTMIDTFITKYDKLAIAVPESKLKGTLFAGLGVSVKIVPQQKIYILQSASKKTVTLKNIDKFTTPFTVVTKNIDLVIKGNVSYNGMFLVKGGTITFAKADALVGGDRCPSTQLVKGIFVTDQGFLGGEDLANNDLDTARCTYGGLTVQGVLIGEDIQNIVQTRRSQLNHRFMVGGSSESSVKAERRNEIFKGASVLIEYSPSLWSSLPPGASDFTKVLDVYKK